MVSGFPSWSNPLEVGQLVVELVVIGALAWQVISGQLLDARLLALAAIIVGFNFGRVVPYPAPGAPPISHT